MKLFYKEENYPFFYSNACGKLKGVLIELWETIASMRGEELSIEKISSPDANDECLPMDAFSYVSPRSVSPEQTHSYRYSTWIFVEPTNETLDIIPNFIFYFVFTFQVLLYIFLAFVLKSILEKAIKWVRKNGKNKNVHPVVNTTIGYIDFIRLSCIIVSFYLLELTWQGNFNGNTLITIEKQGTIFTELISQFNRGKRKLVIEAGVDYFDDGEAKILFGGSSNFIYGNSVSERLRTTCDDFSRVGFFYETDFMLYQTNLELQSHCNIARISLLPGESTPVPWLTQNMREGKATFHQFHRNETKKNRELVDFALLSVYRFENLNDALMVRHLDARAFLNAVKFLLKRYTISENAPMNLDQASVPISILIVGLILSLIVFYFEFVVYYSHIICCSKD
ncbi:hypothetical protein PRIPAC_77783 [Pristionchus pacificus]|uniref:Uncharacterized protein n=1 Tax=Pristionchus pacificus TaxID=54126 RepID=A0A2A6C2L0_PRIPA|nr:hypothetical protein PRIPAC_77783 [Pristionchus pacificus]|eukprot:PDM72472.1 hypothetical protein PRIPAC_38906 [Pristionchus pacificus]